MKIFIIIVILKLLVPPEASSQENGPVATRFMFYNVENLFDTLDDSLTDDNEFLPGGERRWTPERYRNKINSLSKVIISAGDREPPDIIGLCEVENKRVLQDLISSPLIYSFGYSIVHENSYDLRGIDVALIYRPDKVKLLSYSYLYPPDLRSLNTATRSILYCRFLVNSDTLHIVLNHWPSRRGGVLAGEASRKSVSDFVRILADSISSGHDGRAGIIISGDFNAAPSDNEILSMVSGDPGKGKAMLVNLADQKELDSKGTYKYRGFWEIIDQIIVSDYLLLNRDGIYTDYAFFRIIENEFLLIRDDTYTGMKPSSTYAGFKYTGGFSDHLPVILDIRSR